ncbi:MAG: hypothetical protein L3J95_05880 [Thermoplasmata archaeon]|nr:hypothetical protein [Thermoplasmata archaeon]MCI4359926.1 hypothetical protein [Thermoplasmata archaeon]
MAVHRAAPVIERELFAEYPFLPGAEALIEELAPSVGALFRDASFDPARAAGRARIRAAIDDPAAGRELAELAALRPDERFLSFQFARLVLSAAPGRAPIRRWSVWEAKSLERRLLRAPDEVIRSVAERLGYEFDLRDGDVSVDLPEYLRLATPIREAEFRLARQALTLGRVTVGKERAVRLLEEAVRLTLTEPVPISPGTRSAIEEREREFLSEVANRLPNPSPTGRPGLGRLRPELFPPCIRLMRRTLEDGENLSHSGRFALAAFLYKAGADLEAIVDSYRGAPDFDESVTRYQVDHITRKDGGAGYEPPDCATLRTHGLCAREGDPKARDTAWRARDPLCFEEWLRHPLQYYRTRGERSPSQTGSTVTTAGPPGTDTKRAPGEARSTDRR